MESETQRELALSIVEQGIWAKKTKKQQLLHEQVGLHSKSISHKKRL